MGEQVIKQVKYQSVPRRIKNWFSQLSFWKKIIIIFTLNTFILLILTDAIMLVLFGKISDDIISISNTEKDQFNFVSNTQIAGASAKMVLGKIDVLSNILTQLSSSYYYFMKNPSIYSSYEAGNSSLPKNTSQFLNLTYTQPGILYLTSNSTRTDLSFLDQLLSRMIRIQSDKNSIKRINIYVQSNSVPSDISVRTIPATNTFTVDASKISTRFAGIVTGKFKISDPYKDQWTNSSTKDLLIGLRTMINTSLVNNDSNSNKNIYLEVQIYQNTLTEPIKNIYYFSTSFIIIAKKIDSSYQFYSNAPSQSFINNIGLYYPLGTSKFVIDDVTFVSASVGLTDQYDLGLISSITNRTNDPLRCIVLVQANQSEQPAIQIQSFLNKQSSILKGIVFCWSFIILLSTIALATVVGNYIFSNLKMLSTKMDEYIHHPHKFHLIVIELKQLQLKGILKKLSDNLIGIIQKIEVRKRERKDRINQNYHPLSVGEPKFQERQQLNDFEVLEEIKEEVRLKVQAMKKEAEDKAEKEKTTKLQSQKDVIKKQ